MFRNHRIDPVPEAGESMDEARKRVGVLSEDIEMRLLNEIEGAGEAWSQVAQGRLKSLGLYVRCTVCHPEHAHQDILFQMNLKTSIVAVSRHFAITRNCVPRSRHVSCENIVLI
jgi:hypothetical protein